MPMPTKEIKHRVKLSNHAGDQWRERTGCSPNNVERLLTALLNEQMPIGLPMRKGQLILKLSAETFGLTQDVMVPLIVPADGSRVWLAPTILQD